MMLCTSMFTDKLNVVYKDNINRWKGLRILREKMSSYKTLRTRLKWNTSQTLKAILAVKLSRGSISLDQATPGSHIKLRPDPKSQVDLSF